ncbi:MAG: hypothetical protein IKB62_04370 [Oscillospiraceae bacterium]|nr:hypothetical protein [Oscillospiraceae bacterium]
MIYGNDLSHHQSADAVLQLTAKGKAQFLIFRTGFGTHSKDKHFARYIADSEARGYKNSVYHASYAGTVQEAVQEADFCIDLLEETGAKVEMPVFYDYEYFSAKYNEQRGIRTTPQLVQELTTAFCERVKQRGYRAGVYFNKDYLVRFYTEEYFEAHPDYATWYARPGYAHPDYPCDLWQYASNDGTADFGYKGAIDKNILVDEDVWSATFEAMEPLSADPCRLYIGFASSGDIETLVTYIEGLGIHTEVVDGYIITDPASKGDQCYIMTKVNKLGNIDCRMYEEEDKPQTEEDQLSGKTEQLEKDLIAEREIALARAEEIEKLKAELYEAIGNYGRVSGELSDMKRQLDQANRQLAAERASNEVHSKELAQCKDKLNKIKEIVGG